MYANSKFYPFHPVGYDQIAEIELTVKVIAMANARIHVKLRIVMQIGLSNCSLLHKRFSGQFQQKVRDVGNN